MLAEQAKAICMFPGIILHQTFNIRRIKSRQTSRLAIVFAESIEVRSRMKNEVALTGDAPITSEWSTIDYSGAAYNSGLTMHMCDACDGI